MKIRWFFLLLKIEHLNFNQGAIYIPSAKRSNSRTIELKPFQVLEFQDYLRNTRLALSDILINNDSEVLIVGVIGNSWLRLLDI